MDTIKHKLSNKEWFSKHPNYKKEWYVKHPGYAQNAHRKMLYKISQQEYDVLFSLQKGCCILCNTPLSSLTKKSLSVDHNHKTGKVRGLLCTKCNSLLGFARDDIELLRRAIKYLGDKP